MDDIAAAYQKLNAFLEPHLQAEEHRAARRPFQIAFWHKLTGQPVTEDPSNFTEQQRQLLDQAGTPYQLHRESQQRLSASLQREARILELLDEKRDLLLAIDERLNQWTN